MIDQYKGKYPQIDETTYVAPNATIVGDVKIGENCSVWLQTVIHGDVAPTIIGNNVNIQDLSLIHQSTNMPLILEDGVSILQQVTSHSCTVRNIALIVISSILLEEM